MTTPSVLLVVLAFTSLAHFVDGNNFEKLDWKTSCTRCVRRCGTLKQVEGRNTFCNAQRFHMRKVVKRNRLINNRMRFKFREALVFYCWKRRCNNFKFREYCGLKADGKKPTIAKLNTMISDLKKENVKLEARWRKESRGKFRHGDYRKRRIEVLGLQQKARAQLNVVLNARKENWELRKRVVSTEFRKQMFDVNKYSNETRYYVVTRFYWQKLSESLKKAVRSSSLSIAAVRRQLQTDTERMKADVRVVRRLSENVKDEERTLKILKNEEKELTRRLEEVKLETVDADGDYMLFRRVSHSIERLLDRMAKDIRDGKLKVECGNEALAMALAQFTTSA